MASIQCTTWCLYITAGRTCLIHFSFRQSHRKNSTGKTVGEWGQLKAATFFLWSYLQAKVYEICPVGTPDFKCKLATYWSHPNNLPKCVMGSMPEWIQECRGGKGGKGGHPKACFQCWRLQLTCHWVKNVCICLLIVPFLAFQKLNK